MCEPTSSTIAALKIPPVVSGFSVNAFLDTGLSVSTLSSDILKQLGIVDFIDLPGGMLLRTASESSLQAIGSITIRIAALGQQRIVNAQVFRHDVILEWPEFKALLQEALRFNQVTACLLDASATRWQLPLFHTKSDVMTMKPVMRSISYKLPELQPKSEKHTTNQPASTETQSKEDSNRFPETHICTCGKTQNSAYDPKIHLFGSMYVSGRNQGFFCTWKKIFHYKTKWTTHLSQCKGSKETISNPGISAKLYCYHAADNEIFAKVSERYHEELEKIVIYRKQKLDFCLSLSETS